MELPLHSLELEHVSGFVRGQPFRYTGVAFSFVQKAGLIFFYVGLIIDNNVHKIAFLLTFHHSHALSQQLLYLQNIFNFQLREWLSSKPPLLWYHPH